MTAQMLLPAAVLVLWSLIVLLWVAVTRFGAFKAMGIDLGKSPPGGRGVQLEGVLPDKVNWKAHNYTHLMEQPTIFYPTVIILAMMGATRIDLWLAWSYVLIRVVHSLWQAMVNKVPFRASLFFLSTFCLIALAVRAIMAICNYGA